MRLLNPNQRANLKDQLDEWIQQGIIEPANSPWALPLVQVKKKDGRTRWVTDLRLLNDITVKDAYPLKNIQENLQKLKGAKIFSSVNACGAYHCIKIEENSRDCAAFISPFGTFHYIRMPFGLSNAGSIYGQMLDLALAHLPVEYWLSYLDDFLVYSMYTWDHLSHLKSIVEAHTKAWKMSSFLGFTGYYCGFIPKYPALTNRMNSMKKAEKFDWSEDGEGFFGAEGRIFSLKDTGISGF